MQQLCPKINPRNSTTIHCLTSIQYLSGKGGDYYYMLLPSTLIWTLLLLHGWYILIVSLSLCCFQNRLVGLVDLNWFELYMWSHDSFHNNNVMCLLTWIVLTHSLTLKLIPSIFSIHTGMHLKIKTIEEIYEISLKTYFIYYLVSN